MDERLAPALFDPTHGSPDEAPSQALLPSPDSTVLFVCRSSSSIEGLCAELLQHELRPSVIQSIERAPHVPLAPHHCFIDWSLPGAPDYLSALVAESSDLWPVALVQDESESSVAYASGAVSTLRQPLYTQEVLACLRGHRARRARRVIDDAVLIHDQRVTAADAFETMIRSLGQELRTPLATALANLEYLVEEDGPGSDPEQKAVLGDTLEAMQSLRSTLDGMAVLLPHEPPVLEQVRLWRVAQRVLDALPSGAQWVELRGEPGIRGWGDETILFNLITLLVRRALGRHAKAEHPIVSLHVYAHDTEARITVRERPETVAASTEHHLTQASTTKAALQDGLQLASARHAVVKMGGLLNYIAQSKAGCAFRVRLRLAQPA